MSIEVINLDSAFPAELEEIARTHTFKPYRNYAARKLDAYYLRLGGRIEGARIMEDKCDAIYEALADQWKW